MKKMAYLLFGAIIIALSGCLTEQKNTAESAVALEKVSYQDSVFWGFDGDLTDPRVIWDHLDVYLSAHDRMMKCVYLKNQRLAWDIKSGSEIKISENIYKYLTDAMTYENEVLLPSGEYEICWIVPSGYYAVVKKSSDLPNSFIRKID